MNEQRAKLVRIGELALLGLAALLTIYMAVTLVNRLRQHGDFNELLVRYEPAVESPVDAEASSDAESSDQADDPVAKEQSQDANEPSNKEQVKEQNKDAAENTDKSTDEHKNANEDKGTDEDKNKNGDKNKKEPPDKDGPPNKAAGSGDDKPAEPKPDPLEAQVKRVAARNIFAPPKEPPKFSAKLVGMLGDEAIFEGNKYAKVGQDIMGAKVKAMGPDWVEVEFEGKTIKQWVFGPREGPPASPPNPDLTVDVPPDLLERFKGLAEDKQAEIQEKLPDEMRTRLQRAL